MIATERLYYDDSLLFEFNARVVGHSTFEGKTSVLLDQSAFYPEGGGQNPDHGSLSGRSIIDVQVDDDGLVHHMLKGEGLAVGEEVLGRIDTNRRRLNMALHTGQHMLSRALLDVADAPTVSSRLGEGNCTVDLDVDHLSEADVHRAETLVNEIINEDRRIRAFFPADDILAKMVLRRSPKVKSGIRVVEVEGFDLTPCGGTHCTSTAQIGLVRIRSLERYKGMFRVSFAAGSRARNEVLTSTHILQDLARSFSCSADGVPKAIDKLRENLDTTHRAQKQNTEQLADLIAHQLKNEQEASPQVIASVPRASRSLLVSIADRIIADPKRAALLAAPGEDGTPVVALRGTDSNFDCGAFLKAAASLCDGRGGGRPERAEGRLPSSIDWVDIARQAIGKVHS